MALLALFCGIVVPVVVIYNLIKDFIAEAKKEVEENKAYYQYRLARKAEKKRLKDLKKAKKQPTPHNILVSGNPDPNFPSNGYVSPFPKEKQELDKEINKGDYHE